MSTGPGEDPRFADALGDPTARYPTWKSDVALRPATVVDRCFGDVAQIG